MSFSITLRDRLSLREKIASVRWSFVLLVVLVACVGFLSLYSAAGGSLEPWAQRQMQRFAVGLCGMIFVALIDPRIWLKLAYPFYAAVFLALIYVDFFGRTGMGAQRWIDLGFIQVQPSEFMKIAVVLALARFFHSGGAEDVRHPLYLILPTLMVLAPCALVMIQPDLGTALKILMVSGVVFFLAGVSYWMFAVVGLLALSALPVAWHLLHDYQKDRVLTFINPENDPLGAGYHIIQSKIALGSGGLSGKGFLQGTQSKLNFLPEKQTDFIFTMLASWAAPIQTKSAMKMRNGL